MKNLLKILILILAICLPVSSWAADTKISAFPLKTTPVAADVTVIVDSVGGANKKITLGTIPAGTATNLSGTSVGSLPYQSASGSTNYVVDVAAGQPLLSGGTGTAPAYAGFYLSGTGSATYNLANFNAATVTNGVYTTGAGTVFQPPVVTQPYTSATPWQVTPAVGTTGARIIVVCASVDHALTIMAHSGTPVNGQILEFWFQSNTSAHALDFTTATTYRNLSAVMPTTTVISKWTKVGFRWNAYATTPIWDCDAAGQQP